MNGLIRGSKYVYMEASYGKVLDHTSVLRNKRNFTFVTSVCECLAVGVNWPREEPGL